MLSYSTSFAMFNSKTKDIILLHLQSMKKQDAELKANALAKDLIEKEAEHKGSKRKCLIYSVEAVAKQSDDSDFDVFCFFDPIDNEVSGKKLSEEIDYFLSTYKILDIMNVKKTSNVS
ncbi:hypothetical protein CNR22_04470 [Sphingobacteriaceae bacterium]|nr:hypothetical protein CNR22_04470 [Sphingobacteriaceae bacterium]